MTARTPGTVGGYAGLARPASSSQRACCSSKAASRCSRLSRRRRSASQSCSASGPAAPRYSRTTRPPRTASIDSQSVDTSEGGEVTGRDNAKTVTGRKRHIAVDSLGMLLAVVVTAASVDDAAAAQPCWSG